MEVNGGHGVDSHGRERKERRNSGHTEYSLIQQWQHDRDYLRLAVIIVRS